MSETVKLIIEIPKETYLEIKDGFITRNAIASAEAIKNGIPLEEIRAEIEKLPTNYCGGYIWLGKEEVLQFVDHIGKGE